MNVREVLSNVPQKLIDEWQMIDVFKEHGKFVGAMFRVTDEHNNDFKFALSKAVIEESDPILNVFGWEIKAQVYTEVQAFEKDGYLRCVPTVDVVEVRESNLDYIYDAPHTKEGFVFVDGRKYKESDVVTFNLVQNLLDALEVCTKQA